MRVRRPHCRSPIEIVNDAELSDIPCPSCGSSFSLVVDETVTHDTKERVVAHFRLTEKLGVGAFGTVWKATDTQLDRTVAIKIRARRSWTPTSRSSSSGRLVPLLSCGIPTSSPCIKSGVTTARSTLSPTSFRVRRCRTGLRTRTRAGRVLRRRLKSSYPSQRAHRPTCMRAARIKLGVTCVLTKNVAFDFSSSCD